MKPRQLECFKRFQKVAIDKGGECLSNNFNHSKLKMNWKCRLGHIWSAIPNSILSGSWCPKCNLNSMKNSIEYCHEIAKGKGGFCLQTIYENNRKKMTWKCKFGHIWRTKFSHIQSGHWCPICSHDPKKNKIEEFHAFAKSMGGFCLEDSYKDGKTKMRFKCREGHIWNVRSKRRTWCPICANNAQRDTLENCHKKANEKNGVCLSDHYENNHKRMKWKCEKGHIWEAKFKAISRGAWCRKCSINSRKPTIEDCQNLASKYDGFCLNSKYLNAQKKMKWQCKEGHLWEVNYNAIQQGKWCPYCKEYRGENVTRRFFENLFNAKFPKQRPSFLRYTTGRKLELDGYNPDLKIAFEHNGDQHYKRIPLFHKTPDSFEKQKNLDKFREDICAQEGIKLFVIRQIRFNDPELYLKKIVKKEAQRLGFELSKNVQQFLNT